MSKEKTHPLIRQYHRFFDDVFIRYGFNIEPGWHGIVAVMLWRLNQLPLPGSFRLTRIKEKLGSLRVYHNDEVGEMGNFLRVYHNYKISKIRKRVGQIIGSAVRASATICEYCGASGAQLDDNKTWLKTLCPECKAERK